MTEHDIITLTAAVILAGTPTMEPNDAVAVAIDLRAQAGVQLRDAPARTTR